MDYCLYVCGPRRIVWNLKGVQNKLFIFFSKKSINLPASMFLSKLFQIFAPRIDIVNNHPVHL